MASFHGNILVRLIQDLGAQLALEDFEHQVRVLFDATRVEAHLVTRKATAFRAPAGWRR